MKSAAQDGLSKRFSLSRISAISLFPSGVSGLGTGNSNQVPSWALQSAASLGHFKTSWDTAPTPHIHRGISCLGSVVGMGLEIKLVSSQTSSGLWPPQGSPRIGPSGGPKIGKWSHLIQKKSVELRFNERGRERRQQAAFADCLPLRKENREGRTSKENPPGTLGDSSLGRLMRMCML